MSEIELEKKESQNNLVSNYSVKDKSVEYVEKHAMKELLFGYVLQYRSTFIWACIHSILNKIFDLAPPIIVGIVIDSVNGSPPNWVKAIINEDDAWELSIFLALIGVVVFFFESVFEWRFQTLFMSLAQNVQHQLRLDVYSHVQNREMTFFEDNRLGETLAMLNDDINQLEQFLNTGFNEILQLLVLFVFAGAVLFITSPLLSVVGLFPIPILIYGSFKYHKIVSPRYKRVRSEVGRLTSRLENNISGMAVIKSFCAEQFELERVESASNAYKFANLYAIQLSALYVPVIRMIVSLGFGGVLLFGSYWVLTNQHDLSVGDLVLFSMMVQRLLWPLTRLGQIADRYERSSSSCKRTFKLLAIPSTITSPENPSELKINKQLNVTLENVTFGYNDTHKNVISNVSLEIKPFEFLGVCGTTGAGKSTLIKLLLRLYDVNNGSIKINNIDIRHLNLSDLRKQIALVSQDVYLFHGTIRENLQYSNGNSDVTSDEKMIEASRLAAFHDFVETLPDGYDSIIGERGIKLSGGQRQRLSIARAIIKNAPIMIFDEATSAVDTQTEFLIQKNMNKWFENRIAIVIAHRLSTIRHADRIIVLSEGKIVEEGDHDSLLKLNETYANLWHTQTNE